MLVMKMIQPHMKPKLSPISAFRESSRSLFYLLGLAVVAVAPMASAEPEPAKPAPAAEQRELLSSHDTIARFTGISDHRCRGLTALCPDRCGHSGRLATFEIVKYLAYQKPGKYGDEKGKTFSVLIEDNLKNAKVPEAILKSINSLKPGALVHLQWNHDYITRDGSRFPERPIVRVEELTPEQAEAAAKERAKPE